VFTATAVPIRPSEVFVKNSRRVFIMNPPAGILAALGGQSGENSQVRFGGLPPAGFFVSVDSEEVSLRVTRLE
jgi:hypothetical protein